MSGAGDPEAFVRANTLLGAPQLVPEIRLHLANEVVPLWQMTETEMEASGLPPPYWAFAWAGGQALARHVLDHPETVAGRHVLDFGAGSGIVAIAAARAGAARVTASEIDPFAAAAIRLNAAANGVAVESVTADLIGSEPASFDLILAADVCYERPMAERLEAWLRGCAARGVAVLLGDPGRFYLPKSGLEPIAEYRVETTRELEDSDLRLTRVWRLLPAAE
jgi:predicted nicotinamide N-methyase